MQPADTIKKSARQLTFEMRIHRFVERILAGDSQVDAYRNCHRKSKKLTEKNITGIASVFANRPAVKSALKAAIDQLPLEKIVTQTAHLKRMVELQELSVEKANYTAASAFGRIVGQGIGLLRDTQVINNTWKMGESDLLQRMAGDDPAKQAAAKVLLGSDSFAKPPKCDTLGPDRPDNATKH